MPPLRPVQHLEQVARDYPGIWTAYAQFLADRVELGDWPAWCYCPLAAAYAVVSARDRLAPAFTVDVARVGALAAWRPTQGVYRFDPTLLEELCETPVTGDLPVEHLQRLPEWCVYVETPILGPDEFQAAGFFAHLEHDANHGRAELRILLDSDQPDPPPFTPIVLHLGGTLEQSIQHFAAECQSHGPFPLPSDFCAEIQRVAAPIVSILLYLCAGEAELRPTRDPARKHAPQALRRNRAGEPYLPPGRPEVWETGFHLGATLRAARAQESQGGTVRGHVRRAHWHGFWRGSGEARRLDVRWLPPIPVKLDGGPDAPTVRKVDT